MGYDYYWLGPNGVGQLAAKRIGLSKATGIMSSTLDSGDLYYLFQSRGNLLVDETYDVLNYDIHDFLYSMESI